MIYQLTTEQAWGELSASEIESHVKSGQRPTLPNEIPSLDKETWIFLMDLIKVIFNNKQKQQQQQQQQKKKKKTKTKQQTNNNKNNNNNKQTTTKTNKGLLV